jgi:hypothetical protein
MRKYKGSDSRDWPRLKPSRGLVPIFHMKLSGVDFPDYSSIKNTFFGWASVAHACTPSYSGGREEED